MSVCTFVHGLTPQFARYFKTDLKTFSHWMEHFWQLIQAWFWRIFRRKIHVQLLALDANDSVFLVMQSRDNNSGLSRTHHHHIHQHLLPIKKTSWEFILLQLALVVELLMDAVWPTSTSSGFYEKIMDFSKWNTDTKSSAGPSNICKQRILHHFRAIICIFNKFRISQKKSQLQQMKTNEILGLLWFSHRLLATAIN